MLVKISQSLTYLSLFVSLFIFVPNSYGDIKSNLLRVSLQNTPKMTRVNFIFSKKPEYKILILDNPRRIVLDIYNNKKKYNFNKLSIESSYIDKISSYIHKDKHRVVFRVSNGIKYDANYSKDHSVLHIKFYPDEKNSKVKKNIHSSNHVKSDKNTPILRNIRILIDPGHGGTDPGAVGVRGTCEKDITLDFSKLLKKLIDQEPGLTAMLTRHTDRYLHIRTRLKHARKKESDLFISVHADGFKDRSCKGASVYVLSRYGATTEAARWIAAHENYSVLGRDIDLKTKDSFLRTMLYDLSQTATSVSSMKMASYILGELKKVTHLHSNRIESAPFAVLKSPDIPSILVELGFISNKREESKLNDPKKRYELAVAIVKGLKKYISSNPIKSTYFAKSVGHTVKRGDNLAKLAMLYSTTVKDIKKMNKLSNNIIFPGMKLQIPNII